VEAMRRLKESIVTFSGSSDRYSRRMLCEAGSRGASEKSDHWHRRLLRLCRERPGRCRAAKQRDELAAPQVEHGLVPGTRSGSLQQAQDTPEAPAGPWATPESF
jgi:hypothetical protein